MNAIIKMIVNAGHDMMTAINPRRTANSAYRSYFSHSIDFDKPKDLFEKIFWMELYSDTYLWTSCADKFLVRDYVKEKVGGEVLADLLGVYDNPQQINWEALPNEFVLKPNHGSGDAIIVRDKKRIDKNAVEKNLNKSLKSTYGFSNAQFHYCKIKPKIVAEQFLTSDEYQRVISPNSLIDYKIWCFNGSPRFIWVAYDRTRDNLKMSLYDTEWNELPEYLYSNPHYTYHPEIKIPEPACLKKMLEIASALSNPFPECRVDLYVVKGKPYFGELTFSSGFGYFTEKFYQIMGEMTDMSKIENTGLINVKPLLLSILKNNVKYLF